MSRNNKPSRWKKLKMWFWSKSKTIEEITIISQIADLNINKILNKIETLQQNKMYVCIMPGATLYEVMTAKETFERAKRRLNWTAPKILFLNQEIKLMTGKELNTVIELNKQTKGRVEQ